MVFLPVASLTHFRYNKHMRLLMKLFPFTLVILLTVFAVLSLFHSGFYPMHDDEQIARLFDLDSAIKAGNIPPRIAPNLGFGYGYPFFNFYPSFAYYIGEIFHLLGFGFIVSIKLMLATGFILAAIFMYLFTKEFFGKVAGVVAAIVYTYASYHAVDVYVRGAYAEFFAYAFIPLIFLATYRLAKTFQYRYVAIGVLGVTGLILSHNLVALMSFPFLAIWLVYLFVLAKNKLRFVVLLSLLFLLGFGMSAYFSLPSYLERDFTLINILTSELADYSLHFVCVHQLWNSAWGYGGSIPSCSDGLSFEIGKIPLILSAISFILASYYVVRKKLKLQTISILLFAFFLLLSSFLMVKYSEFIWKLIPPLWYVQFPWRFLLFTSFAVAFLSGSVLFYIKNNRIKIGAAIAIVVVVVISNLTLFSPEKYMSVTDDFYTNQEKIRWETSSLAYEYVPKGIKTKKSVIGTTFVDINKNEIKTTPAQVISGDISYTTVKNLPQEKVFQVNVKTSGILQINTYSFPGWKVYINRNEVKYQDNNKLKLIRVSLDQAGTQKIEAKFTDTPVRFIGNMISVISIIILILGAFIAPKFNHDKT